MSEPTEEQILNLQDFVDNLEILSDHESIIQDNKNYFKVNELYYRVEMPNQEEQMLAEDYKDTYKFSIMGKFPSENQLKKRLKEEQNIDIEKLEEERQKIKERLKIIALKGASLLSHEVDKIEKCKEEENKILKDLFNCIKEIEENLEGCLERKITREYYRRIAFFCTKKKNGENWVPVWSSFEEYNTDRSGVSLKAIAKLQQLFLTIKK